MSIPAAFLPLSKARRDHAENVQMKQNQLNYTRGRGFESIKKKRKKRVENELKILFGGSAEVVGRRSAGTHRQSRELERACIRAIDERLPALRFSSPYVTQSLDRNLAVVQNPPFSLSLGVFHASDNSRLCELRVPLFLFLAKILPPLTFDLLVPVEENRI